MIKKILVGKKGDKRYYRENEKVVNTRFGKIDAKIVEKAKDGDLLASDHAEKYTVYTADFIDKYKKMGRGAQMVPLKDIGHVIARCGIGKNSIIIDAGSGSGGSACFFAHVAKQVYSYDNNNENIEKVKKNIYLLGLNNITTELADVYEKLPLKDNTADLWFLDVTEPWNAIHQFKKVKIGGWIVAYSPSTSQVQEFVNAIPEEYLITEISEIIVRNWKMQGKISRPDGFPLSHSGFLVFVQRLQ